MPAPEESASTASRIFAVKDCALIAIATGRTARTLGEFHDCLRAVDADTIYYHFWGGLLQPRFEEREYNNDFAAWARHGLHDGVLAERMAVIDPTAFAGLEALRQELVELIEQRQDESETLSWRHGTMQFEFIRARIVVFDTGRRVEHPRELAQLMPNLSTSSIFYHFIDARRRLPDNQDDFRFWLSGFEGGYPELCAQCAGVDPYFGSLTELRSQLAAIFAGRLREGEG